MRTGTETETGVITKITWERVLLHLTLTALPGSENTSVRTLNVTNDGHCRCIQPGIYRLGVCTGDALRDAESGSCDRVFRYRQQKEAYSFSFLADAETKELLMTVEDSASGKPPLSHRLVQNYYNFERALLHPGRNRKHAKRRKQVVLFLSEQSDVPGGNLTAVRDRMRARKLDRRFEIIESYRRRSADSGDYRKTLPEVIRKIARADVIFLDDHVPLLDYLRPDRETKIVQLWHAGVGFKSSGYSRWGHQGCPAPFSCHRQYTYGIVGSKASVPIFSEIWGINDDMVLPLGMPRIDSFLNQEHREQTEALLREHYPQIRNRRVILFAPTYRGKSRKDASYPFGQIDFQKLYEFCRNSGISGGGSEENSGSEDGYAVLFRMHPWVTEPVPIPEEMKDRFVDASDTAQINDLLYVTDLLITDYSSNICEFSLLDRPMLFFAFDEETYGQERGFHRDYETYAPGKVCRTFEELLDALAKQDYCFPKVREYVERQFDRIDDKASDRVIRAVLGNRQTQKIGERREPTSGECV